MTIIYKWGNTKAHSFQVIGFTASREMKREGRQHGVVRSHRVLPAPWNPRPESRFVNRVDSPPTAGLFTKVSPKPTNHSKFTGKCARPRCVECHIHPVSKSKDKAKGTQKLRASDVVSNHRLVTWRVVDAKPGLKLSGFSATGILDHLASDHVDDDVYEDSCELAYDDDPMVESDAAASGTLEIEDNDHNKGENNYKDDDDENDERSFCDVASVWDRVDEDEGWCLVGEIQ